MDEQHVSLPRCDCDKWIGVVVGVSSVGVHIRKYMYTHVISTFLFSRIYLLLPSELLRST